MNIKYLKKNLKINESSATSLSLKVPHIFIKYVVEYIDKDVYKREKYLGDILNKFDWFPKRLYCDDINHFFIYKNVGEPITIKKKPKDLEKQFNKILSDLKSVNVQHNDIKMSELLVDKNNKLYLCDFGWGSVNNDIGCGIDIWGCNNKDKPGGYIDDASALNKLKL